MVHDLLSMNAHLFTEKVGMYNIRNNYSNGLIILGASHMNFLPVHIEMQG